MATKVHPSHPRPTHYHVSTRAGALSIELGREGISRIEFLTTPWEHLHQDVSDLELDAIPFPEDQSATAKHIKWLKRIQKWPCDGKILGVPEDVFHPEGTPFQKAVWMALRSIPFGETRTYQQIANGLHTGPRAVASACAANPLALWIPCHRVVPKRGGEGGYAWGSWRKALLLDLEQSDAH
jgi:O-6-methylguanine DNA methyltransferase